MAEAACSRTGGDCGVDDRLAEQTWYRTADVAGARGWTEAARHMRHYLDDSGPTLTVDPARMRGGLAPIQARVAGTLDAEVAVALDSLRDAYDGTPAATTFDSGWRGGYAEPAMSRS